MSIHRPISETGFVIYDVERTFDERVFRHFQDVRDFIVGADLGRAKFIVVEFDTAQGWCRDITDLFMTEEAEEPTDVNDRAASVADRRYQLTRELA